MESTTSFFDRAVRSIKSIPKGSVATYGMIARLAGSPKAARQVAYILSSSWQKHDLPWHRVVNSKGGISLKRGRGYEEQKELLEREGVAFDEDGAIDLSLYGWRPERSLADFDDP